MRRLHSLSPIVFHLAFSFLNCSKDCTPQLPKANFTYKVTSPGQIPAHVNFISSSSNAYVYSWMFGDGSVEIETTKTQISHIFGSEGTYKVMFVAMGEVAEILYTKMFQLQKIRVA